jgi:hypothetical protein
VFLSVFSSNKSQLKTLANNLFQIYQVMFKTPNRFIGLTKKHIFLIFLKKKFPKLQFVFLENQSTVSHKDFSAYCDQSNIIIYICNDDSELNICLKLIQNGQNEVKIGKTKEHEHFYTLFLSKNFREKILLIKFDDKSRNEGSFTLPYEWYPLLENLIKASEYYNEINNENFTFFKKFLKSHFKSDCNKFVQNFLENSFSTENDNLI